MNVTWCLVYLLPFPWHMLAGTTELAYALRDCNGETLLANQQSIAAWTHQSTYDGLGPFVPVFAWSSSSSSSDVSRLASFCRTAIETTRTVPVQLTCVAGEPTPSWWNRTHVPTAPCNDAWSRGKVENERTIAYLSIALFTLVCLVIASISSTSTMRPVSLPAFPPLSYALATLPTDDVKNDECAMDNELPVRPYVEDDDGTYFSPYGNIRDVPNEEHAALHEFCHTVDAL